MTLLDFVQSANDASPRPMQDSGSKLSEELFSLEHGSGFNLTGKAENMFREPEINEPSRSEPLGDSLVKGTRERSVTDENRKDAKERLGKDVSQLISETDAKTIKSMQEAILDGDPAKLAELFKSIPPERLKAFVKELNKELKAHNAGIELTAASDGRVFLYSKDGQSAVQFNRDGTTSIKPISHKPDGSVVLEPGEIINRDVKDVMKGISDTAVSGITGTIELKPVDKDVLDIPPDVFAPKPFNPLEVWPRNPTQPLDPWSGKPRLKGPFEGIPNIRELLIQK